MSIRKKTAALVVAANPTACNSIKTIISSLFSPVRFADSLSQARQMVGRENYGLVIINTPLQDGLGVDTGLDLAVGTGVNVLLIVKADIYDQTIYKTRGSGIFVISRPLKRQILVESAAVMSAVNDRLLKLDSENKRLKRKLDELKEVSRAKCLLIEREDMREDQAHSYLQQMAMDNSESMRQAAQSVIDRLGI